MRIKGELGVGMEVRTGEGGKLIPIVFVQFKYRGGEVERWVEKEFEPGQMIRVKGVDIKMKGGAKDGSGDKESK
jgi:2,3-bisphosphoglycerate-independent phosphoglycerate mutase